MGFTHCAYTLFLSIHVIASFSTSYALIPYWPDSNTLSLLADSIPLYSSSEIIKKPHFLRCMCPISYATHIHMLVSFINPHMHLFGSKKYNFAKFWVGFMGFLQSLTPYFPWITTLTTCLEYKKEPRGRGEIIMPFSTIMLAIYCLVCKPLIPCL
jgi:hypothetical protein